jgi:hypothetical protein
MKNIQVIDDAENCVYDIFQASEQEFNFLFPNGQDIAFFDDIWEEVDQDKLNYIMENIWNRPIKKSAVNGIHGTIFYGMDYKKKYYPTLKDEEAINPDGTHLRRN